MNGTPRLRSAFPSSPLSAQKDPKHNVPTTRPSGASNRPKSLDPTIPFELVDAPSQRLYVLFFYSLMTIWRIYDYSTLYSDEIDGFWLFTKWIGIDTVFLYALSGLRIPWLEWSSSTFTALLLVHGVANWLLMFRIPLPLFTWLGGLTKVLYDRELAVSERKVKPASILHNASLILGKQIVHILPEGSATLNPHNHPFCVDSSKSSTYLPIQINQTLPITIDLLRVDIETSDHETITISAKEIRRMTKQAQKASSLQEHDSPLLLQYPIANTGIYKLQRVVDESKLEVQRTPSLAVVVECPRGWLRAKPRHKCKGDLSDFSFQVHAAPPVKISYSKVLNGADQGHATLHVHPENLRKPDVPQRIPSGDKSLTNLEDVSWAKMQTIDIPMNESLGVSGDWLYVIDGISDVFGNVANYSDMRLHNAGLYKSMKSHTEQHFSVHERPFLTTRACDSQQPLKVEKGKTFPLPIDIRSCGPGKLEDGPFTLTYLFVAEADSQTDQTQLIASPHQTTITVGLHDRMDIKEPGLYRLHTVASTYCEGEVLEPSSCLLTNPPEPDLSIASESITDKCAGNPIGLYVDLNLLGTPPFRVYYSTSKQGGALTPEIVEVKQLHTQIELRPRDTGHYTYEFSRISDAVYEYPISLARKSLVLEQDVKAPPSAYVLDADIPRRACVDEAASLVVLLTGDPPFKLEYELVHGGKRIRGLKEDIYDETFYMTTEPLSSGGRYTLGLTSLTDKSGCKMALQAEVKIDVNLQKPQAAFGSYDGSRSTSALEGQKLNLPLRLQGESPWTVSYHRVEDVNKASVQRILRSSNDFIEVTKEGTYELEDVHDSSCPGLIDAAARTFNVSWIPRPSIAVRQGTSIHHHKDKYVKDDVCQGDEDATDIVFTGAAPFNYEYEQRYKPAHGSQALAHKRYVSGLHQTAILMETSEPGLYEYKFSKLGDQSYSHDRRRFQPILIQQTVHPRPSGAFAETGRMYKYCQGDSGSELVPLTLTGQAPFHLELEIKQHAISKPELITIPHIESHHYNLQLPRRLNSLGTHTVTIRKVQDARGCQGYMDRSPPQVQISVTELPSISPMEGKVDYCVGDRISYTLSGTPPFHVFYNFEEKPRRASVPGTDFTRIAERPGDFVITAVSDQRSTDVCKAQVQFIKVIHQMPSVRVSKGRVSTVDIHEGGEAEIMFDFGGTPPFHFT